VSIPESIRPLQRAARYEQPVFEALERAKLGYYGGGGGTTFNKSREISEVDFDLVLLSLDAIPVVVRVLEERGVPKGTTLRARERYLEVHFGTTEGLAIFVDATLAQSAGGEVKALVDTLVGVAGVECRDSWIGKEEAALVFYGNDAQVMFEAFEPILRDHPLTRFARVVIGYGGERRREVQL